MDRFLLDLHLTITGGAYNTLGELQLFCWLKAVRIPGMFDRGNLVVVHPGKPEGGLEVREEPFATEQVEALLSALRELGFPAGRPRIDETFDTSDVWQHVVLRSAFDDDTETLELELGASGFEGPDAAGLRRVFRHILAIAGLDDLGAWHNLTGRRPAG